MKTLKILSIILMTTLISCSTTSEEMDEWENEISQTIKAKCVSLYHQNTSTAINGRKTLTENYLQLDIYNSELLKDVKNNQWLYSEKCQEIKDLILNNTQLDLYPPFNELRFRIIENRGFLIFNSEEIKTITYKLN